MLNQRVVLITGASSGVGQSTARLLSQRGYRVFGTSRNPTSAESIPGVEMLSLDVGSDDSAAACVEAVSNRGGSIDVLINNAAFEMAGALEELSQEEVRAQFETNFFGVIRMVNAVLPLMRRENRGQIINVSSLTGLSALPFLGIYSASKFALEGYTEALRHEVKPFNIQVSLTEAGFLRTPMMNHRQLGARPMAEYEQWRQRALDAIRAAEEKSPGPEVVAETLLGIVSSDSPPLRNLIGRQAKSVTRLRRFLPAGMFEEGVRRTLSLDRLDGGKMRPSRQETSSNAASVERTSVQSTRAASIGAAAIGALALSATAVGALAIGWVAVGSLRMKRGHVHSLSVEDLDVGRLHVRELVIDREIDSASRA